MMAVLEIDLDAVAANWRTMDASHGGATAGVVKADAYGLGAKFVVPKLLAAGCRDFFVAHLEEAVAVRPRVPGVMFGVLNGIRAGEEGVFSAHRITPVLGSLREVAIWRAEAARVARELPAILHVDTGMARLGLAPHEVWALQGDAVLLEGLRVEYVMTHLACADEPGHAMNARQAASFRAVTAGFPGVRTSFANSSGMFLGSPFWSDLARPGAALYGVNPTPGRANPMRDVVTLRAPILQVREIAAGETVGYGGFWTAQRASRIAVVGVGYADGVFRALSNAAMARFDGAAVPLVGRVSMDLTTFDVTDVPAGEGDILHLLGAGHGVDGLAAEAGTNGYEVLTALGRRYKRTYLGA